MKKLLLLLTILIISCSKDETPQESFECECEFFGVYAGTSGAENGASINLRECESIGLLEEEPVNGRIFVKPGNSYERLLILSTQQDCRD